ncbi:type II secretion system F family protein [Urbifossiella limnaea]|uniref:Bacterial type II secretion system protein F domain protein n=1 Tax=Urbifossiella limnaea TaxID=2528023 RepID=A0A517XN61_9BACT|nr:type II secretion system F family protein [Urbifossiella limnaea]QDU18943.1 Bacterial type II secretion system protein F domain protein [Urbifossiella limnaea]
MTDDPITRPPPRWAWLRALADWCERRNSPLSPAGMCVVGLLAGSLCGAAIWLLTDRVGLALLDAAIAFPLPWVWLELRYRAWRRRFEAQLPDALALVASALQAGHSLAAGLTVVAEEMAPPSAAEFGRVYEEQLLGVPLDEALTAMLRRVGSPELRLFTVAIQLQRNSGGQLDQILDRLASLIRARRATLGYAAAVKSAMLFDALLVSCLPPAALLIAWHVRADAVVRLWEPADGVRPGAVALAAWGAGALWVAYRAARDR